MEETLVEGTLLTAHVPEKTTLYLDFIDMFAKLLGNPKSKRDVEKLGSKMITVGLSMMVLAPDHVARAFIFWKATSASNDNPEATIDAFGDLIIEMRKDLVGETVCVRDDAVGMFLRDQV